MLPALESVCSSSVASPAHDNTANGSASSEAWPHGLYPAYSLYPARSLYPSMQPEPVPNMQPVPNMHRAGGWDVLSRLSVTDLGGMILTYGLSWDVLSRLSVMSASAWARRRGLSNVRMSAAACGLESDDLGQVFLRSLSTRIR